MPRLNRVPSQYFMAKKTKDIVQVASELETVSERISDLEKVKKSLRDTLLVMLHEQGPDRQGKIRAGNYQLVRETDFKIADVAIALPFALSRDAIKVDVAKVHALFRKDELLRFDDPTKYGFEEVVSEKNSPIKTKKNE